MAQSSMVTTRRPTAWVPLASALVVGVAFAGTIGWWWSLHAIDRQVKETRAGVKKLILSGGIPPNQEVMNYLTSRQTSIERAYQHWVKTVAAPPAAAAASADPQLYFQEQFHEVQRTLERLAGARGLAVPTLLGFPKELPPSDTVPRLLVQLSLIQETATVMLEQGASALTSFKIEDPDPVLEEGGSTVLLTRLPIRVRLSASLPQLMKIFAAMAREKPLIDLSSVRMVSASASSEPRPTASQAGLTVVQGEGNQGIKEKPVAAAATPAEHLEVELVISRYLLAMSAESEGVSAEESESAKTTRPSVRSEPRAPRSRVAPSGSPSKPSS